MTNKTKNFIDSILRGHLYLLVFLLPLIFWPDTMTVFTLPKLILLRTLSISALAFLSVKFFAGALAKKGSNKPLTLNFPKGSIWLALWLLSLILSTIFTINLWTSLFGQYGRYLGLFTEINFLLIPFFIIGFWNKEKIQPLISVSLWSATLVAIYGLLQYFDFFGLFHFAFSWSDAPQNRVFSTIGHANHLGAWLAGNFFLLVYNFPEVFPKHKNLNSIFQILLGILFITVILLTASRGAILALLCSLIVVVTIKVVGILRSNPKSKKVRFLSRIKALPLKKFLPILLLIGLLASGITFFSAQLLDLGLIKRTEQTISSIDKGYLPERLSFMKSSINMFLDHPLTGTGLSTFRDAYSSYRLADFTIDGPGNAQYITVPEAAHNEYLNILAGQGIIGPIAFLGLIWSLIATLSRQIRLTPEKDRSLFFGLLGALLVFLIQVLFSFGELVNLTFFYLLIGLIFLFQPTYSVKINPPVWLKTSLSVLLAVALIPLFYFGVMQEASADFNNKQAELASLNDKLPQADQYYRQAISARPQEFQLYQNYANFLLVSSQKDKANQSNYLGKAIQNYQQSISLNPNFASTYHNLALTWLYQYATDNQPSSLQNAKTNFELSVAHSPNNPRYLYEYARKLHSIWDDKPAAVKLLKQAIQIAPTYQEPQDYLNFLYKNHPELKAISN